MPRHTYHPADLQPLTGATRVLDDIEHCFVTRINGLEEKSLWFWGRKSGALVKFCLTCALEFPILQNAFDASCKKLYRFLQTALDKDSIPY